jgi:signal transduction histidine kinase
LIGEIIETTLDGGRKIHVDRKEQDLVATVREALELCEKMRGLRNVEVSLDLPESLYVSHDRVQLGRVLHNLIKNAIEAASEASQNRSVHISIKNLEAVGVEVVVDDSGTGIVGSPDRLFRAFQSTKTRGTGLGLLVSQRIAEAHFGKITASNRSKVGGARFSVTLPSQTSEASI